MKKKPPAKLKRPMISFQVKIILFFLLIVCLIGSIFVISARTNRKILASRQLVNHTDSVLSEAKKSRLWEQSQVAALRGYVITGDPSFLTAYEHSGRTMDSSIKLLEQLTKDTPLQQARIDSIRKYISRYEEYGQKIIELRKKASFDLKDIQPEIYRAKGVIDTIQILFRGIQKAEEHLLAQRRNLNRVSINDTYRGVRILILLFFISLLLAFVFVYLNTRRRNKTEAALRKSDQLINALINNTSNPIFLKDLKGKYLIVNEQFHRKFNLDKGNVIGKSARDILPPEIQEDEQRMEDAVVKSKNKLQVVRHISQPDGTHTYITTRFPLLDDKGEVYAVGGVATEITDLIKAQEALEQNHDKLQKLLSGIQKLFNASQDVICVIDEAGNFVQVSESSMDLWGYKPKELEGKPYIDFVLEEDRPKTLETAKNITSGVAVSDFENRYLRKDGQVVPVCWTAIWSEENKMMYCIAKDETESRQTAEQLAQSQEKLINAQKLAKLGNWEIDLATGRVYCSEEMYRIFGIDKNPKTDLPTELLQAVHPDDRQMLVDAKEGVISKGKKIDVEHRILKKDKTIRFVQTRGEILNATNGSKKWLSGTTQDITERKQFELQLQELNHILEKRAEELAASNSELERFAYVASHDLQEPLRMVSSFLHLLKKRLEGQLDDSTKTYIHFAVDGAERMKSLIQDLLNYSRIGTQKEAFAKVDLNVVLKDVLNVHAQNIRENAAKVQVHNLPVVNGNKTQLTQVFQNLIGNALKYRAKEDPCIEISCSEEQEYWQFMVRDNGIGIDPKFFDKIFIIFQRLHNKTEYSGTGIGLAIAKKIVERHGGRIWVDSTPGAGSTFYFTLQKDM